MKKKEKNKKKKKSKDVPMKLENIVRKKNILFYYIIIIIIDKKEQEMLRHQANTGFGKMVLAGIKTEPQYSIGKAQRSPIYEIIKTPGPIYSHKNLSNLKFSKPPEWKIGDEKRKPLYSGEIYNYYKYPYDEASDLSKIPKKWKEELQL